MAKHPDNNGGSEDDGERFLYEVLGLIPKVSHEVLELRHMVSRKFHNERRGFAFKSGRAHQEHRYDSGYDAEEVHSERDYVSVAYAERSYERACNGGKDREFSAAREERNNANGRGTFLLVCKRTGVDHCRHRATEAHDHGEERSAGKTELTEHSVENERDTSHIAAVF